MRIINIISKTDKGNKAINQHYDESLKMKIREKLMFKASGYEQKIAEKLPLTLSLYIKNPRFEEPLYLEVIKDQIKKALESNNAKYLTDFYMEVQ